MNRVTSTILWIVAKIDWSKMCLLINYNWNCKSLLYMKFERLMTFTFFFNTQPIIIWSNTSDILCEMDVSKDIIDKLFNNIKLFKHC